MKPEYSQEFWYWYDRCYCQSPTQHEYDDEKMWEAWKAGYKQGRDNAYSRKDIKPETFTILKHLDESINDNYDLFKDLKD